MKDELFQTQQRAKDREAELTLELEKTMKKLAKTQDRIPLTIFICIFYFVFILFYLFYFESQSELDQFVLSLHQEQQNTAAAIEELTTISEELRTLKASNARMLEESAERADGICFSFCYSPPRPRPFFSSFLRERHVTIVDN